MEAEFKAAVDQMFVAPSFVRMWGQIHLRYMQMGFTDHLSDGERIKEYKYITEQYRKFVFKSKGEVMKLTDDPETVQGWVDSKLATLQEAPTDRKALVYATFRDDWLTDLYNTASMELVEREGFKEDEDAL